MVQPNSSVPSNAMISIPTSGHNHNCLLHSVAPQLVEYDKINLPEFREEFNNYYNVNYNQKQFQDMLDKHPHPYDIGVLFAPLMRLFLVNYLVDYKEQLFQLPEITRSTNRTSNIDINGNGTFMDFARQIYKGEENSSTAALKNIFSTETMRQIHQILVDNQTNKEKSALESYKKLDRERLKVNREFDYLNDQIIPQLQETSDNVMEAISKLNQLLQEKNQERDDNQRNQDIVNTQYNYLRNLLDQVREWTDKSQIIAYLQQNLEEKGQAKFRITNQQKTNEESINNAIINKKQNLWQIWNDQAFGEYQRYLLNNNPSLDKTAIRPLMDYFGFNVHYYYFCRDEEGDDSQYISYFPYNDQSVLQKTYLVDTQQCDHQDLQSNAAEINVLHTGTDHYEALLRADSAKAKEARTAQPKLDKCPYNDRVNIIKNVESEQKKIATGQQWQSAQHVDGKSYLAESNSNASKNNINSLEENRKRQNIKLNEGEQDQRGMFSYKNTSSRNYQSAHQTNNEKSWHAGVNRILRKLGHTTNQPSRQSKNFQERNYEYNLEEAHSILNQKWRQKFQDLTQQKQQSKPSSFNYVRYINSFFEANENLNNKDEDYLKALELQEEELADYFKELEDEEQANHKSKSYNHS